MIKNFYGGLFINKAKLEEVGIRYPIKIEYYKICDNTRNKDVVQYGIEVVKTEYKKENIVVENEKILNVTNEEKMVNGILEKMKENEVTPVTVKYVLEDLMYADRGKHLI